MTLDDHVTVGERSVIPAAEADRPGLRERLAATRRLVGATRRVMQAVTTTALTPRELHEATVELEAIAGRLGRRRRTRPLRVSWDETATVRARTGEEWQHFEFNPLGIPLRMRLDGDTARARLALEPHHEGPPGLLHGGFSAAMMDALLGGLVQTSGVRAVTGTLELRFRRSAPVEGTVDLGGRIVERAGRKIMVEGWIDHEGERCVEARALFISVDDRPVRAGEGRDIDGHHA